MSSFLQPHELYIHGILQATVLEWVAVPLLQEIFPTQGSNPGIEPRSLTLQVDSLPDEPPGKPKNTRVGSLSLFRWIFPTRNQTGVSCIADRFFTSWATREQPMSSVNRDNFTSYFPILKKVHPNWKVRSKKKILMSSVNRDNFISYFPICMYFFFFLAV